jgi:hypothetical protein
MARAQSNLPKIMLNGLFLSLVSVDMIKSLRGNQLILTLDAFAGETNISFGPIELTTSNSFLPETIKGTLFKNECRFEASFIHQILTIEI